MKAQEKAKVEKIALATLQDYQKCLLSRDAKYIAAFERQLAHLARACGFRQIWEEKFPKLYFSSVEEEIPKAHM